jgi:hypothetical protein
MSAGEPTAQCTCQPRPGGNPTWRCPSLHTIVGTIPRLFVKPTSSDFQAGLSVASRSSTVSPSAARCSRAAWQYGQPGLTYMTMLIALQTQDNPLTSDRSAPDASASDEDEQRLRRQLRREQAALTYAWVETVRLGRGILSACNQTVLRARPCSVPSLPKSFAEARQGEERFFLVALPGRPTPNGRHAAFYQPGLIDEDPGDILHGRHLGLPTHLKLSTVIASPHLPTSTGMIRSRKLLWPAASGMKSVTPRTTSVMV